VFSARIVALGLAVMGVLAVATPASATTEQYRLKVPDTAKAGTTLTGIKGSCAGDGSPSLISDAFVGGQARMINPYAWTAEADIVETPGYYYAYMICAGGLVGMDDVTVIS
jgi:hypothetical protein